ncbi:MAG: DUF1080 domain-containing protein [Acidobacteria bacterium]|nr:DUF1080 domain-containing protein [Acidobacteriota bacterium]
MRSRLSLLAAVCGAALLLVPHVTARLAAQQDGWLPLFDGQSLDGWKVGDNASTFSVQDGAIVVFGPRAHLYYMGPIQEHVFTNFEWKADVMTMPGANSGMYFHTEYQETGWPQKGYEVQVNNSHTDPIRTGSLYNIVNVMNTAPAKDHEWFTQHIIVIGKQVTIKVNGKTTAEYTEPDDVSRPAGMAGRLIAKGTFALQGHDPKSRVHFKNLLVKPLP